MNTLVAEETKTVPSEIAQEMPVRRGWLPDALVVGTACLLFLGLCLYQLDLPGLYTDEAFDVVPSMQMLLGHPVELQRGAGLHLFGLDLPLMSSSDYQGVTSTYLVLPFFALGGINVYSLRLMTVLVGALGVLLAFFLAKSWFGRAEARVAVLLLAVSPAWIFWSRLGVYVVSEVVPIGAGALLGFTAWARRRPPGTRNGPLYTGLFLLGLGVATKLLFLWFIVAVGACALLLYGRTVWEARSLMWRQLWRWLSVALAGAGAFCLGAFPFLLYNAMTRGTLDLLRSSLSSSTTTHGVNNAAFVRNLWTEADAFKVLLDGGYFWFQGAMGRVYSNPLTPALFAISAVGSVSMILISRPGQPSAGKERVRAPAVILSVGLAFALFLSISQWDSLETDLLALASIVCGGAGAVWLAWLALRDTAAAHRASWWLLAGAVIAGAAWWFGGAGRPEGPAPGAPFGLWSVDAVGVIFWLTGAALVVALGFDSRPFPRQRVTVAALIIIGLVVAQSAVTVSGLWSTHLLMLLPLPQIIIAAFLVAAYRVLHNNLLAMRLPGSIGAWAVSLVLAGVVGLDLGVDYLYHRDLALTGGGSTFSDAIYRLAGYLDAQPGTPQIVAMDWGFKRPLQLLTEERINPLEAYGYSPEPTPQFREAVRNLLTGPDTIYLFHTPEGTAYPRFEAFQQEAQSLDKEVSLVKTFYHRDGVPVYLIYQAK